MNLEFFDAVTQGDASRVKEMLKAEPRLARASDEHGVSALLKAAYYRKQDVIAVLLDAGAEIDVFEAAATGQTGRVRSLVKDNAALANAYSRDGFMPLGLAVFFGHQETVEALLAAGAEVNAVTKEAMKVTPLQSAAAAGRLDIARVLIAHGANADVRNPENGFAPLHEAAARGDVEFGRLLLDHGADINATMSDGRTPLGLALERKQAAMAAFLRERGAV